MQVVSSFIFRRVINYLFTRVVTKPNQTEMFTLTVFCNIHIYLSIFNGYTNNFFLNQKKNCVTLLMLLLYIFLGKCFQNLALNCKCHWKINYQSD